MLELLTLALCIQTLPCTQILGDRERAPKERKEPQRSSSHQQGKDSSSLRVFCLPDPAMSRRDPLLLYLFASGVKWSLPAPCCIKPY